MSSRSLIALKHKMMRIERIPVLLAALICALNPAHAETFTYANPLGFQYSEGQTAPRKEMRDPCIIRAGGIYYLVFTMYPFRGYEASRVNMADQGGSPGIAIYSSQDLKSWKFDNWLVKSSDLPMDCPYKDRFWAPQIHQFGGKFYLIFTADNWIKNQYNPKGRIGAAGYAFVGVADQVTGPYRHITNIDGAGCDTALYSDENGQTYAAIPKYNIYTRQIDLRGIERGVVKLVGDEKLAVACKNDDIGIRDSPNYLEGPWVERIGARYYLFHAATYRNQGSILQSGYWTEVAYADSPLGPWKKNPRAQLFKGGHLGVFDGPGGLKWFSYRGESRNQCAGQLCIDPIGIDANGFVTAGEPTVGQRIIPAK